MDAKTLNALVRASEDRMLQLEVQKGEEYVRGSGDRLANFKRIAESLGLTPLQVWAVYANKHWDALLNYIRTGSVKSNEPIESRVDDLTVYLRLLRGLIVEHEEAKK